MPQKLEELLLNKESKPLQRSDRIRLDGPPTSWEAEALTKRRMEEAKQRELMESIARGEALPLPPPPKYSVWDKEWQKFNGAYNLPYHSPFHAIGDTPGVKPDQKLREALFDLLVLRTPKGNK